MTTLAKGYIVRSKINPHLVLCRNGEFLPDCLVGPGHIMGARVYRTFWGAKSARSSEFITVETINQ